MVLDDRHCVCVRESSDDDDVIVGIGTQMMVHMVCLNPCARGDGKCEQRHRVGASRDGAAEDGCCGEPALREQVVHHRMAPKIVARGVHRPSGVSYEDCLRDGYFMAVTFFR
jgi:hypothetical protein